MSEKENVVVEEKETAEVTPADEKAVEKKENNAVANVTTNLTFNEFSWLDVGTASKIFSLAKALSNSKMVPDQFRGDPASCMIVMELADRMNLPLMAVFQNVYVVNGKPSWSGKYCIIAIEASGKFYPPEYVWYHDEDGNVNGCSVQAVRKADNKLCVGAKIDWATVTGFGWEKKSGSMWNIPGQREQMYMYRASEYFVNAFCPEMFAGMYSEYSQRDISGYEDKSAPVKVTVN
jgi:hypothetical protein